LIDTPKVPSRGQLFLLLKEGISGVGVIKILKIK